MRSFPVRWFLRWLLLASWLLLSLLPLACFGGGGDELSEAALSERDVPADWLPADFEEAEGRALWDRLPELLASNSEARLIVRAFHDEAGLHGAATVLIETTEPSALPKDVTAEGLAGPLSRFLTTAEEMLSPQVRGGDPGTYVTAIDEPLPHSLRSRLVRLLDDDRLLWDSVVFRQGSVLGVTTVWYPERDGSFQEVEALAGVVVERLRAYSDGA